MSFLDFFSDLWKPYGDEDDLIKYFFDDRFTARRRPAQYNQGSVDYKAYDYDLDNLCSFEIFQRVESDLTDIVLNVRVESLAMFPNPKRIAISEPTKTEITSLQFNSKVVERGGMILKNLSISGNFGFFPGRHKVAPQGVLPKDGIGSGLFFWKLHTGFFRFYSELVANHRSGEDMFLVFNDHVTQESWIIEPTSIDSEQTDAQKYQFPYNWTFSIIAPYESQLASIIPPLWDSILEIVSELKDYAQAFERFAGRLNKFILDFVDVILGPLFAIIDAIDAVISGIDTLLSIPKAVVAKLSKALEDLQNALDFSEDSDGFPLEIDSAFATQNVRKELNKVLAIPELFNPESDYALNENSVLYESPTFNNETGELMEVGVNAPILASETIKEGDSIQVIAKRIFGTFSGWEEIVAINNLRPPYVASQSDIDSLGLKNVIAYGEKITFTKNGKFTRGYNPRPSSKGPVPIVNETGITRKMSSFERALGTDIFLNKSGDIEFHHNDFRTISGVANVKQQISTKFSIEKGKLKSAEFIGLSKAVGRSRSLSEFRLNQDIRAMVKLDDRFTNAETETEVIGDKLTGKTLIKLANVDEPIPVAIKKELS